MTVFLWYNLYGDNMASAIIHMCVAKRINEVLKVNEIALFLGSIAPDISKQVKQSKNISHFITDKEDVPNVDLFLEKYKTKLNHPFELGYYIHLLTDKYWYEEFMPKLVSGDVVILVDGSKTTLNYDGVKRLIYDDYTNINITLIDHYKLSLKLFYEKITYPTVNIKEMPTDDLSIVIDKMGIIIENSNEDKTSVFDCDKVVEFIDECAKRIMKDIRKL